jgi:hypothetical protein
VTDFIKRNSQNKELVAWLYSSFLAIVWGMSFILIKKNTMLMPSRLSRKGFSCHDNAFVDFQELSFRRDKAWYLVPLILGFFSRHAELWLHVGS